MKEPKWKIGNLEIYLTNSGGRLKLPLTVLIVFFVAALIALSWVNHGMRRQIDEMREEAAVIKYENDVLEEDIASIGSIQSVEKIAREELGMVSPDTILIESQVN